MMFTGLVEELGRVVEIRASEGGRRFVLEAAGIAPELSPGDSVAIDGACQTVEGVEGTRFTFFSMGETLRATTLGQLETGSPVNLERALKADGRLGGHFVTGHVDGTGRIESLRREQGWLRLVLSMPAELAAQIVPKGSLAVDGISLTVGPDPGPEGCELFIIPHTLEHTKLKTARPGDAVNLETDLIGKYVMAYLGRGDGGEERLKRLLSEHGFMEGGRS
jgi:riboflavin synthase